MENAQATPSQSLFPVGTNGWTHAQAGAAPGSSFRVGGPGHWSHRASGLARATHGWRAPNAGHHERRGSRSRSLPCGARRAVSAPLRRACTVRPLRDGAEGRLGEPASVDVPIPSRRPTLPSQQRWPGWETRRARSYRMNARASLAFLLGTGSLALSLTFFPGVAE